MPARDTATTSTTTTTTTSQRELSKVRQQSNVCVADVQRTQLNRKLPQQSDSLKGIMVNAMFSIVGRACTCNPNEENLSPVVSVSNQPFSSPQNFLCFDPAFLRALPWLAFEILLLRI